MLQIVTFTILLTCSWSFVQTIEAYRSSWHRVQFELIEYNNSLTVTCGSQGLTEVPRWIPSKTTVLHMYWNAISNIPRDAFQGLLYLQRLDLTSNGLTEQSIEDGALDLPVLQTLNLGRNGLSTVPTTLPQTLTTLSLRSNQFTNLTISSFKKCQKLQYLDLTDNNLQHFEAGTFDWLADLTELRISENNLNDKSFPPKLFSKNTKLERLFVGRYKLTGLLYDLPESLQHLDYSGNQIITLPSFAFKSLPNLQTIKIYNAQITSVEDNAFFGLAKLQTLRLAYNNITIVTNDTFNGLTGLQSLGIYSNIIRRIESGAFRSFKSVVSLMLSSNQLSTLDPLVLDERILKNISEIYIDENPWYCDCQLRWLREKVGNTRYFGQKKWIVCAGPEKLKGKAWGEVNLSEFICPQ